MEHKVLFCATVDYHFKAFHLPYMKWFKEQGWQVDVAASGNIHLPFVDQKYNLPIARSPFRRTNLTAYKQLKEVMMQNNYSIIHCHTPIGGLLARLAARRTRKKGTKVIYTAHGFHFCKGVPFINWLVYYPVERYLSRHTDSLVTINKEDYHLATTHRFRAKEIKYIAGVGVNTETYKPMDMKTKNSMKVTAGYDIDDFLLFSAGEFNKNKNQQFLIQSMVYIIQQVPNARLILVGEGALEERCQQLADQLGISHRIHFLGFRKDIHTILPYCDVAVTASFREGLPVNVMEAMACELPIVAVNNRGHRELIDHHVNGWLIDKWDEKHFAKGINMLVDSDLRDQFGKSGRKIILEKYSTNEILKKKSNLYKTSMAEKEEVNWIAP